MTKPILLFLCLLAIQFAIELNSLKNSLTGRLYGLKDAKEIGTYWDFL